MIKKIICFLLCNLTVTPLLFAQDSLEVDVKLKSGYRNTRILDLNASPLLYSSHSCLVGITYKKDLKTNFYEAGLNVSVGNNQSKRHGKRTVNVPNQPDFFGHYDSTVYTLNPNLSYIYGELFYKNLWHINSGGLYAGYNIFDRFQFSGIGADNWFFNQLSIQPNFTCIVPAGDRQKLDISISTTVLSYVVKQPFTLDPSLPITSYFKAYLKTGSSLESFNTLQQVDLQINFTRDLSNDKGIGMMYEFSWLNHNEIKDRPLGIYSNSISVYYLL